MGGSLTREVDLKPQFSDLDNLFESDSDSNDDAVSTVNLFRIMAYFILFLEFQMNFKVFSLLKL